MPATIKSMNQKMNANKKKKYLALYAEIFYKLSRACSRQKHAGMTAHAMAHP